MYPYVQFMNPFPHQRNQMQFQPHLHPSYESIPQQLRAYPDGYSLYHPTWPSGGMNGYAYPAQFFGCCNHNFPMYGAMSMPYPHPPTHCCGGYSVHPGVHPCHLPPPHWTMGPPQFEYQKDLPRYQHSICPENTCKNGKDVKIEDLGPQTEPKADVSLVSSDLRNCPYPVIWFPSNYSKDNICGKVSESTGDMPEDFPSDTKTREMLKPSEHPPILLNGWLPVDINKWKSSMQEDDSRRKSHEDNENPYFSLPLFYVPSRADDMRRMDQKNVDFGQHCSERVSSESKASRSFSPDPKDSTRNKSNENIIIREDPRIIENKNGDDPASMKQGEVDEGKKTAQTAEEATGASLKHVGNEERKTSGDGKRRSLSLPKSSKLPPVCLRVDPLPKKKNGSGISKSSSPRGSKDNSNDSFKENIKMAASTNGAESTLDDRTSKSVGQEQATSEEQPKCKTKTIEVHDVMNQTGEGGNSSTTYTHSNIKTADSSDAAEVSPVDLVSRNKRQEHTTSEEQPKHKTKTIKVYDVTKQPGEDASNMNRSSPAEGRAAHPVPVEGQSYHFYCEEKDNKDSSQKVPPAGSVKESKKLELSEDEAAKILQSAYRGYEVRKWEPLKKLRIIKTIQEEVVQLKKRIEELEVKQDTALLDRSRTVIGETIMNLLLKLDSIQGLPSSVRQVRKSVVTDLVSLQEELDALVRRQTEKSFESATVAKSEEAVEILEGQEKEHVDHESGQADSDSAECKFAQSSQGGGVDAVSDSINVDVSKKVVEEEDNSEKHEEPALIEFSMGDDNEVPKEEIPEVIDQYTHQLNDLWQNGSGVLNDKSQQDGPSDLGTVELELLPNGALDAQDSGVYDQPGKEAYEIRRNVEEEVTCVPKTDQAEQEEQLPLEKPTVLETNDFVELKENGNGDDLRSWLVPGLPDEEIQARSNLEMSDALKVGDKNNPETGAEAPSCDTYELNSQSANAPALSENPVVEPMQVCDVCKEMQDSCFMDNEKGYHPAPSEVAEPLQVLEGCEEVKDLRNNGMVCAAQEQCAITGTDDIGRGKDTKIAMNGEYDAPTESTAVYHEDSEQKQLDEMLEMQASTPVTGPDVMFALACKQAEPEGVRPEQNMDTVRSDPKQTDEGELSTLSPASSQLPFVNVGVTANDRNLIDENGRLREMMLKLIEAGQEHLTAISSLSGKVKDLEKKLQRRRKVKLSRGRAASGSWCLKQSHGPIKERAVALAN